MKQQISSKAYVSNMKWLAIGMAVLAIPLTWNIFTIYFDPSDRRYNPLGAVAGLILTYAFLVLPLAAIYLNKTVSVDENFLYVAYFGQAIRLPFSEIAWVEVSKVKWKWTITVYLRKRFDHGEKFKFVVDEPSKFKREDLPDGGRVESGDLLSHPVAGMLKNLSQPKHNNGMHPTADSVNSIRETSRLSS